MPSCAKFLILRSRQAPCWRYIPFTLTFPAQRGFWV